MSVHNNIRTIECMIQQLRRFLYPSGTDNPLLDKPFGVENVPEQT